MSASVYNHHDGTRAAIEPEPGTVEHTCWLAQQRGMTSDRDPAAELQRAHADCWNRRTTPRRRTPSEQPTPKCLVEAGFRARFLVRVNRNAIRGELAAARRAAKLPAGQQLALPVRRDRGGRQRPAARRSSRTASAGGGDPGEPGEPDSPLLAGEAAWIAERLRRGFNDSPPRAGQVRTSEGGAR